MAPLGSNCRRAVLHSANEADAGETVPQGGVALPKPWGSLALTVQAKGVWSLHMHGKPKIAIVLSDATT